MNELPGRPAGLKRVSCSKCGCQFSMWSMPEKPLCHYCLMEPKANPKCLEYKGDGFYDPWREASEKLATAKAALETYAKQVDGVAHIARKALGEIGADSPSHMGFFGGEGVEK